MGVSVSHERGTPAAEREPRAAPHVRPPGTRSLRQRTPLVSSTLLTHCTHPPCLPLVGRCGVSVLKAPLHPPRVLTRTCADRSADGSAQVSYQEVCRGTSLMRKRPPLRPYSRPMRRTLWLSKGVGRFLMSEVSL